MRLRILDLQAFPAGRAPGFAPWAYQCQPCLPPSSRIAENSGAHPFMDDTALPGTDLADLCSKRALACFRQSGTPSGRRFREQSKSECREIHLSTEVSCHSVCVHSPGTLPARSIDRKSVV